MRAIVLLLLFLLAGVPVMVAANDAHGASAYVRQIEAWRAERIARLTAPGGWLSLVGLDWLADGANTIGSAAGNDIVLTKGPSRLGTVTLRSGKAVIDLDPAAGATIDGKKVTHAELLDDSHDQPTTVAFGTVSFYVIDRNGKFGMRIKDTEAEGRTHFLGIDAFPIDPAWRIDAQWVPFDPPHTLETPNVLGQVDKFPVPGKAVFTRNGHTYELLPVVEVPGDTELFVIFADRTSGKQTYGAARFLYASKPKDGRIVLDFNKAYNPPCAFTAFATCPLAPPENRLDLAVTAGEMKYRGGAH